MIFVSIMQNKIMIKKIIKLPLNFLKFQCKLINMALILLNNVKLNKILKKKLKLKLKIYLFSINKLELKSKIIGFYNNKLIKIKR